MCAGGDHSRSREHGVVSLFDFICSHQDWPGLETHLPLPTVLQGYRLPFCNLATFTVNFGLNFNYNLIHLNRSMSRRTHLLTFHQAVFQARWPIYHWKSIFPRLVSDCIFSEKLSFSNYKSYIRLKWSIIDCDLSSLEIK